MSNFPSPSLDEGPLIITRVISAAPSPTRLSIPTNSIQSILNVATNTRSKGAMPTSNVNVAIMKEMSSSMSPEEAADQLTIMAIDDPTSAQFFVNSSLVFVQKNIKWTFIPGTEKYKLNCNYTQTKWECPAGSFCLSPNSQAELNNTDPYAANKCPPGFICPEHTYQPSYCCPGFYCPTPKNITICPAGSYCPLGSVRPLKCTPFEYCPEGREKSPRWTIFIIAIFVLILITILMAMRYLFVRRRGSKYSRRIQELDKTKRANKRVSQAAAHQAAMASTVSLLHPGEYDSDSDSGETEFSDTASISLNLSGMAQKLSQIEGFRMFDIEFKDLGYTLPNGVQIMKGVSGRLSPGRLCAIMGPSGSGKTTFVSLLTGKVERTSGHILINGEKENLSNYQKLIGFVPQDDIMLRELTVNDILLHSAMMRLPVDMKFKDKKASVLETISFLGLSGVINSVIGDEENRGVSGGQRKRVNIGMELVYVDQKLAQPSVLFLDEPTSGLDSSTSREICEMLQLLAKSRQMTIAAIIHSPSPAAYSHFDDVLLLGKGGRVVYAGPRNEAVRYFDSLGFKLPTKHSSEPDFFMDILSDRVPCLMTSNFSAAVLPECWEQKLKGGDPTVPLRAHKKTVKDRVKKVGIFTHLSIFLRKIRRDFTQHQHADVRHTPGSLRIFWLCYVRSCRQVFGNPLKVLMEAMIHLICGVFVSLVSDGKDYAGLQPRMVCEITPLYLRAVGCIAPHDGLFAVAQLICLGVMFTGITVGVSTFGNERVVFWRERSTGLQTFPYFMAKLIADLPRILIATVMFFCAVMLMLNLQGLMWVLLLIVFLTYVNAFAMGYFLSTFLPKSITFLFATAFALVWCLVLSGISPTLATVNSSEFPWPLIGWVWNLSAPRWAIEAYYINEAAGRPWKELQYDPKNVIGGAVGWTEPSKAVEKQAGELNYGYDSRRFVISLVAMGVIAIGWNLLALIGLKVANRRKQK
ncbi:hypothetical protein HK098_000974 [Nowakowskiella sp. JEL0407]|nr:hypothetical protein HK098_000974 [Nowakowskiella sp. JEL0407]